MPGRGSLPQKNAAEPSEGFEGFWIIDVRSARRCYATAR
jgi:hypothetical protein